MLLRNYDNIVLSRTLLSPNIVQDWTDTEFGDGHISVVSTSGVVSKIYNNKSKEDRVLPFYEVVSKHNYTNGLTLGSGTTPAHYDDYRMENSYATADITFGTSISSENYTADFIYDEDTKSWISSYIVYGNATKDITISEIGYYTYVYANSSSGVHALIYREVLDTPVDVPAGENFKLKFTMSIPANPNEPVDYQVSVTTE